MYLETLLKIVKLTVRVSQLSFSYMSMESKKFTLKKKAC